MPSKTPPADVDVTVRRLVARRSARELGALVVVLSADGERAIVEDRARLAARLRRSDSTIAWWLSAERPDPGEVLALHVVDGVRHVVRVRLDDGDDA
ncbi:MAG TPA: hypothetical protein VII82_14220 [Polyangiaceae bacterium]